MPLTLLKVSLFWNIVAALWVFCAIILVLVVLIQKGKGGGLGGAFGGGAAGGILGSKTGDFLTWLTIILAGVFLFLGVLLAKFYRPTTRGLQAQPPAQTQQQQTPAPVVPMDTSDSD
ncbi:MAG: preprotein translocase subunit SecG [Phycisphaerae bacterium]